MLNKKLREINKCSLEKIKQRVKIESSLDCIKKLFSKFKNANYYAQYTLHK